MARKGLVSLIVVVALGLIVWAGVSNYRLRQAQNAASAHPRGQELVLTPDGAATPAPTGAADEQMPPNPLLGKTAPSFVLTDLSGKKVSLASYKGRPVLVNFWATWCGPCKYEIPWLATLRTKYAAQGFEILGVSSDSLDDSEKGKPGEETAAIAKAAEKLHINYPVLVGGDTITQKYGGVDLLPQSFYIDKTGKVVAVITGAGSKDEAEADIKKAIASGV